MFGPQRLESLKVLLGNLRSIEAAGRHPPDASLAAIENVVD